jgi:PAS domain S-box-containing protein/putative nucleotidyltransferase with HDIG domain
MKGKNKIKKQTALEASQTQRMVRGIEPMSQITPEVMAAILNSMSELVVYQDTENKLLWANRAAAESVGLSLGELSGRHCYEIWHQRREPCAGCPVVKARETGQPQEAEITTPDGRVWFIRGDPVRDVNGNIVALVEGTLEITEQKKTTDALRSISAEWRTTFDAISDNVYLLNTEGKIRRCNIAATKLLGKPFSEIIGQSCWKLVHGTSVPIKECPVMRMLVTHQRETMVLPLRGRWFEITADPVLDEADNIVGAVHVMTDITERKRAEKLLRQSEERFRNFFENELVYCYMISPEGIVLDVNKAALKALGYSKECLIGRHWKMIYAPESRTKARQLLPEWLEAKTVKDEEMVIATKQGNRRIVLLSVDIVKDETGQILYSMAVQEDITEIKKAEEALRKANRTLMALSACSSAMVHTTDESELLKETCRIIVEIGGYPLAWVGFTDQDEGKTMRVVAQAGYEEKLLEIRITWGDTKRGRGPIGRAIITGAPHICKNIQDDPYYAPWRDVAIKHGYVSSIALPLNYDGRTFGALIIYAGETDAFDREEIRLLMELSDDLAYGITALRTRAERERTEKFLEESEKKYSALFESAAEGILIADVETRKLKYANPAICNMLGYNEQELRQMAVDDIHPKDSLEYVISEFEAQAKGEKLLASGLPCLRRDGTIMYADVNARAAFLDGRIVNIGLFTDVTQRKRMEEEQERSAEKLLKAMESTIEAISATVETRDPYTAGHQRRVTGLASAIAREVGLSEEQVHGIGLAGIVHDIGKIYVPAEILSKPGRLNEIEFNLIKMHSQVGYNILKGIEFPWPIAQIVLQHHEKMDGSGYPSGLSKEAILLEARIITVADVVEAMASHRPYRTAIGLDGALEEISKNSGILYDADVVDACIRLFREKGFEFE